MSQSHGWCYVIELKLLQLEIYPKMASHLLLAANLDEDCLIFMHQSMLICPTNPCTGKGGGGANIVWRSQPSQEEEGLV